MALEIVLATEAAVTGGTPGLLRFMFIMGADEGIEVILGLRG